MHATRRTQDAQVANMSGVYRGNRSGIRTGSIRVEMADDYDYTGGIVRILDGAKLFAREKKKKLIDGRFFDSLCSTNVSQHDRFNFNNES